MHCGSDLQRVAVDGRLPPDDDRQHHELVTGGKLFLGRRERLYDGALRATLARKCCLSVKNTTPAAPACEGRRRDEPKEIRSDGYPACLGLSL